MAKRNFHAVFECGSLEDVRKHISEGATCIICGAFNVPTEKQLDTIQVETNLPEGVVPDDPTGYTAQACRACQFIHQRMERFLEISGLPKHFMLGPLAQMMLMTMDETLPAAMKKLKEYRANERDIAVK